MVWTKLELDEAGENPSADRYLAILSAYSINFLLKTYNFKRREESASWE